MYLQIVVSLHYSSFFFTKHPSVRFTIFFWLGPQIKREWRDSEEETQGRKAGVKWQTIVIILSIVMENVSYCQIKNTFGWALSHTTIIILKTMQVKKKSKKKKSKGLKRDFNHIQVDVVLQIQKNIWLLYFIFIWTVKCLYMWADRINHGKKYIFKQSDYHTILLWCQNFQANL